MAKQPRAPRAPRATRESKPQVTIYADGSCKGEARVGGYAAVMQQGDRKAVIFGAEAPTSNNRMEITAVLTALQSLNTSCHVTVVSDSQYLVNSLNSYIKNWNRNGWRTTQKTPVANQDLLKPISTLMGEHQIKAQWVRGHQDLSDNPNVINNIFCDKVAQGQADKLKVILQ